MSKLFCLSPGLRVLEKQMQEPPGYRPRGYGICIIEEMDWKSRGNYSVLWTIGNGIDAGTNYGSADVDNVLLDLCKQRRDSWVIKHIG